MYIHTYICCASVYMYARVSMCICVWVHVYGPGPGHGHVHMRTCASVCVLVHANTCVYELVRLRVRNFWSGAAVSDGSDFFARWGFVCAVVLIASNGCPFWCNPFLKEDNRTLPTAWSRALLLSPIGAPENQEKQGPLLCLGGQTTQREFRLYALYGCDESPFSTPLRVGST